MRNMNGMYNQLELMLLCVSGNGIWASQFMAVFMRPTWWWSTGIEVPCFQKRTINIYIYIIYIILYYIYNMILYIILYNIYIYILYIIYIYIIYIIHIYYIIYYIYIGNHMILGESPKLHQITHYHCHYSWLGRYNLPIPMTSQLWLLRFSRGYLESHPHLGA